MNKTYIFAGAGIIFGIFVIAAFALQDSTMTTASTLDEIIRNGDCMGMEAWEEVHTFDDGLSMTDEQRTKAMELSTKCSDKPINNVFGTP